MSVGRDVGNLVYDTQWETDRFGTKKKDFHLTWAGLGSFGVLYLYVNLHLHVTREEDSYLSHQTSQCIQRDFLKNKDFKCIFI